MGKDSNGICLTGNDLDRARRIFEVGDGANKTAVKVK